MKQVKIDSLLYLPQDAVTFQREWTGKGEQPKQYLLLEIAFFAGAVGPGLYIVSSLCGFSLGMLAAFLIVLAGYAVPHALFLGRMERSWRSILRPWHSWISRGSIFAGLFLALAFLSILPEVWGSPVGPLRAGSPTQNAIMVAASVAALLLALYPGFLFSVIRAIPFWHSIILTPLFVTQALGGGIALALILARVPGVSAPGVEVLLSWDPFLILIAAALITAHLYAGNKAGPSGKVSVDLLLHGKYRTTFLLGLVTCGLVLPLLLMLVALFGSGPAAIVAVAALLQLSGILLFKYCLLNVGAYNQLYDAKLMRPDSHLDSGDQGR